jgi:hypothetical protein
LATVLKFSIAIANYFLTPTISSIYYSPQIITGL